MLRTNFLQMNTAFIHSLVADAGRPGFREHLEPYAALIGSWGFDWVGHNEDGSTWTVPGEWHFSWILEGRAIQDNWICPALSVRVSGKYPEGEYGTTIRFWDAREECIKVVWIGPNISGLCIFRATQNDGWIIQEELFAEGKKKLSRWSFSDIGDSSFKWESHVSADQGKSWRLDQEVFAKRMAD